MIVPRTKEELERLVQDRTEESLQLEFKHAKSLDRRDEKKKDEISKDVSAMANAAGGVIIYGVAEREHYAGEITPVNRREYSKEWLNQIIISHIQPRIDGLVIHPIPLGQIDEAVYVVEIPQSNTAHQARDRRYYRRHNFDVLAMEDYEIRDVMNRSRVPVVVLEFAIVRQRRHMVRRHHYTETEHFYETHNYLRAKPKNKGSVLAHYVNYSIKLPEALHRDGKKEVYGDNTVQDVTNIKFVGEHPINEYGPRRFTPILPSLAGFGMDIALDDDLESTLATFSHESIAWSCHADNAPPRTGNILIRELEILDEER